MWLNHLFLVMGNLASMCLARVYLLAWERNVNSGSWITLGTLETTRKMDSIIAVLPLIYFVICKLLSWFGILQKCQQKSINICPVPALEQKWQGRHFRQQELCDEGQLPDRMVNPCEYEQLPQNRDNNNENEDGLETDNLPTLGAYTND